MRKPPKRKNIQACDEKAAIGQIAVRARMGA